MVSYLAELLAKAYQQQNEFNLIMELLTKNTKCQKHDIYWFKELEKLRVKV